MQWHGLGLQQLTSYKPHSNLQMRNWQARSIPGPRVYLAAAYWSLTTVVTIGFGDVTPSTDAERAVMLVVELAGVVFFGILLGSVTSLLQVSPTPLLLV